MLLPSGSGSTKIMQYISLNFIGHGHWTLYIPQFNNVVITMHSTDL